MLWDSRRCCQGGNIVKMRNQLLLAASALGLLTAASASAGPLIVPVTATGSSSYPGYAASNAIDIGPGSELTDWASLGQGSAATLELDLGAVFSLTDVYATDRVTSGGGNGAFAGGLTDFTTSFTIQAFTDATFTTSSSALYTFLHTPPGSPSSPSDFFFDGSVAGLTGRYIKYSVTSNAPGGGNTGLSAIAFGAVPEPATWGMMLIGFAAMGGAMRYRRRETKVRFA